MESRSTEIKVGIMVGVGLALFIISTLMLGGGKKFFTSTYTLKVKYPSVAGVAPGSVVQLLGMPVGNVSKISFLPDSSHLEVEMIIESAFQERITVGSTAGVRTQGALGDKFIFITPGQSPIPLNDGDSLVAEEGGDIFSTITSRGDDIKKVFDIINEAHLLLVNLNSNGKSSQLMPNLVKASDELGQVLGNLNLLLKDVRGDGPESGKLKNSLAHLESVLKKIDKGSGTLGALVNDPDIHERIKAVLGGSNHSNFMKNQVRETIRTEK